MAAKGYFVDFRSKLALSLSAGLSLTLGLLNFLALQPEAFYTRAGGEYGLSLVGELYWLGNPFAQWFLNPAMGTGVSYSLPGGMRFTVEARCLMGLTSVMREHTGLADWKQNDMQFLLGVGWVLAGKRLPRQKAR